MSAWRVPFRLLRLFLLLSLLLLHHHLLLLRTYPSFSHLFHHPSILPRRTFVATFLFQPTAIYDTPWKTFPVYHGTNLHELVPREKEHQQQGLATSVSQSNPLTVRIRLRVCTCFANEDDLGGCISSFASFLGPSFSFVKSPAILSLSIFQTM